MARSRKKHAVSGATNVRADTWTRSWHRRWRRRVREALARWDPSDEPELPTAREVSDPWDSPSDGKVWWGAPDDPALARLMRK